MIIAVDGPTASGKGTIARAIARHFDLPHLDTGMLYRAVGYQLRLNGGDPDNEADAQAACDFPMGLLEEPELRSELTGGLASRFSVHPAVRKTLLERQRAFAFQDRGAVLDGRDIGTVIVPEADVKLFVTAAFDLRVKRRFEEMEKGEFPFELKEIEADIAVRDERDRNRKEAPLRAADDAVTLDTSDLGREEAIAAAIALVEERLGN